MRQAVIRNKHDLRHVQSVIGDFMMKRKIFLFFLVLSLASCVPMPQPTDEVVSTSPPDTAVTSPGDETMPANEPVENPFAPMPGDSNLTRGNVFIQETSLLIRESYPVQIGLNLKGELPTPCNQLRVDIGTPDSNSVINIDVYSVVNPDMMCTQVLKPFEENVNLGTFPTGHYAVFVNGESVGEFDS
jgi:hypothetical protein